jgi:hypothetical protein
MNFNTTLTNGTTFTVHAADKTEAATSAIALAVEHAKTINAKYAAQHIANGVAWAIKSENPADYSVRNIRKLAR